MKRGIRYLLFGLIITLVGLDAHCQQFGSIPEVLIEDSLIATPGAYVYDIDSILFRPETSLQSLDELMNSSTSIFIKDNGPGMLSTPTYRGGDAGHTSLLWNGVKINSPLLGVSDFTSIQSGLFSSAQIFTGTSANLFASGGVGAAINLLSQPSFKSNYLIVDGGISSFGNRVVGMSANRYYSKSKIPIAVNLSLQQKLNQNEFSYINNTQVNQFFDIARESNFRQTSILGSIAVIPSSNFKITLNSWISNASREVANPINIQTTSQKRQLDTARRFQLAIDYKPLKKISLKQNIYYETNSNHYLDTAIMLGNNNKFYTISSLSQAEFAVSKLNLSIQYLSRFTEAQSNNFNGFVNQFVNEAMINISRGKTDKRLNYNLGSRISMLNSKLYPQPFASLQYRINSNPQILLTAAASRTVRLPTLNELYWTPGGNPAIQPEIGNTQEVGARLDGQKIQLNATLFAGQYQNRIRWLPTASVFSPVNIAESNVLGGELNGTYHIIDRAIIISLQPIFSYTKSIGKTTPGSEEYALTYTPEILYQNWIRFEFRDVSLAYNYRFIDSRYITSDESAYMPAYNLHNAQVYWTPDRMPISLGIRVNNVLNTPYQNMPWFAMPGRSFQFQLRYKWERE